MVCNKPKKGILLNILYDSEVVIFIRLSISVEITGLLPE